MVKFVGALDDFVNSTLVKVPGALERLRFLAELHDENGYEHWGLTKAYGPRAAQSAIAQAHSDAFERVLTTSLEDLVNEDSNKTGAKHVEPAQAPLLLPEELKGGSEEHLKWVLRAISLLRRSHH